MSIVSELTERAWKHRFSERLSQLFIVNGIAGAEALEDAYAHADHQYGVRGNGTPEHEAGAVHGSLADDD
jgi:hypothetical protein